MDNYTYSNILQSNLDKTAAKLGLENILHDNDSNQTAVIHVITKECRLYKTLDRLHTLLQSPDFKLICRTFGD